MKNILVVLMLFVSAIAHGQTPTFTKTVSPESVLVPGTVEYTFTVTNPFPTPHLFDIFDESLDGQGFNWDVGTLHTVPVVPINVPPVIVGGSLKVSEILIPANTTIEVIISENIDAIPLGTYENQAALSWIPPGGGSNTTIVSHWPQNPDGFPTPTPVEVVGQAPTFTKTVSPEEGESPNIVVYTFTITNNHPEGLLFDIFDESLDGQGFIWDAGTLHTVPAVPINDPPVIVGGSLKISSIQVPANTAVAVVIDCLVAKIPKGVYENQAALSWILPEGGTNTTILSHWPGGGSFPSPTPFEVTNMTPVELTGFSIE